MLRGKRDSGRCLFGAALSQNAEADRSPQFADIAANLNFVFVDYASRYDADQLQVVVLA
jgi:hypothetical protein